MRGSAKGCEPEKFRAWKELQREAGLALEYDALPGNARDAMRRSLYEEQTGQCVYCGRGISLNRNGSCHVEHFRPRRYRDLQLEYTNLFLSCGPEGDGGAGETCGRHKDDWFEEEHHIAPVPESCAERFRFRSSGKIVGDGSEEAQKMIEVLNLCHRELAVTRRDLIENLDRQLNEAEPGAVHDLLQDYLDTDGRGARPSFANVAISYLTAQVQPGA